MFPRVLQFVGVPGQLHWNTLTHRLHTEVPKQPPQVVGRERGAYTVTRVNLGALVFGLKSWRD